MPKKAAGLTHAAVAKLRQIRHKCAHLKTLDLLTNKNPHNDVMDSDKLKKACLSSHKYEVLRGVVALVAVSSESAALRLRTTLSALGATVASAWSPFVTHVIYNEGGDRVARAHARSSAAHVVSPHWVDACAKSNERVPEQAFPAGARPSDLPSPNTLLKLLKIAEKANIPLKGLEREVKMEPIESDQPEDLSASLAAWYAAARDAATATIAQITATQLSATQATTQQVCPPATAAAPTTQQQAMRAATAAAFTAAASSARTHPRARPASPLLGPDVANFQPIPFSEPYTSHPWAIPYQDETASGGDPNNNNNNEGPPALQQIEDLAQRQPFRPTKAFRKLYTQGPAESDSSDSESDLETTMAEFGYIACTSAARKGARRKRRQAHPAHPIHPPYPAHPLLPANRPRPTHRAPLDTATGAMHHAHRIRVHPYPPALVHGDGGADYGSEVSYEPGPSTRLVSFSSSLYVPNPYLQQPMYRNESYIRNYMAEQSAVRAVPEPLASRVETITSGFPRLPYLSQPSTSRDAPVRYEATPLCYDIMPTGLRNEAPRNAEQYIEAGTSRIEIPSRSIEEEPTDLSVASRQVLAPAASDIPIRDFWPTRDGRLRIVLTAMSKLERSRVFNLVKSLDAKIQKRVNFKTTHVVVGTFGKDPDDFNVFQIGSARAHEPGAAGEQAVSMRTLNSLLGAVRGCRVVTKQWLYDSYRKRTWLAYRRYAVPTLFKTMEKAYLERHAYGLLSEEYALPIFEKKRVHLSEAVPSLRAVVQLLKLCGAVVYDASGAVLHNAHLAGGATGGEGGAGGTLRPDYDVLLGSARGEVDPTWVFDSVLAARAREVHPYLVTGD